MEKVLYGDLGSEKLIFGNKQYEIEISGIYNTSGKQGYGFKPLNSTTGIWYFVDKYGGRGGGYISAYIGPITDSPIETLLSLNFATVEDFENQRTEWSGKALNDTIQENEEKNKKLIGEMDDKEVEELLFGCINASDNRIENQLVDGNACKIVLPDGVETDEKKIETSAFLLKRLIGNLPITMQRSTSFLICNPEGGHQVQGNQITVLTKEREELTKYSSNCYFIGSPSKNKKGYLPSTFKEDYMKEYLDYLINCAKRYSRTTSRSK